MKLLGESMGNKKGFGCCSRGGGEGGVGVEDHSRTENRGSKC